VQRRETNDGKKINKPWKEEKQMMERRETNDGKRPKKLV
jgi:hypothetical protein